MPTGGRHSNQKHRSGGGASRSTASSSGQQYVLPATTYVPARTNAGSGGQHNSGGSQYEYSSGDSSRGRMYDQYARDHTSTPSGTGSQRSQEVPLAHYPSANSGPQQPRHSYGSQVRPAVSQGSNDRFFVPGSAVASSGSGSARAPTPGEGRSQGYYPIGGLAQSYGLQQEIDSRPPITYGPGSKSAEKVRDMKRGTFSRFVKKSAEKAKEAKDKLFRDR